MKKLVLVFAVLVFATVNFAADTSVNELDKAVKAYTQALKSDNPGVRVSALHQIASMKSEYPSYDFSSIDRQVVKMVNRDDAAVIRVNAKLTSLYLNDSELTTKVKADSSANPTEFFNNLYLAIADDYVAK